MRALTRTVLVGLMALANACAQAGVIDDLLATPAIQPLHGRRHDLPSLVRNCENATLGAAQSDLQQ